MSGHSPSRLRTKTSDLADFFRPSASHSRQPQNDPQTPVLQPPLLDIPHSSESPVLKKMTKIPFLGRTRKKSTHSTQSGAPAASTSSTRGYDSSEITDSKTVKQDRRLSHPVSSESTTQPPLPTTLPPSSSPSVSLGSKFAAHFTPSKSRKLSSPRVSRAVYSEGESDVLLSPPTPRATSFDSRSSVADGDRSTTPRPKKPTITVSLSPDNVDDYKDLFTLPRAKRQHSVTPASQYRDKYHGSSSNVTLSPTSADSRMDLPSDSTSTKVSLDQPSRSAVEDKRSSMSSKNSVQRYGSIRHSESVLGSDVPVEESADSVLAPVIDIRPPSPATRKPSPPIPRSPRLKTPVSDRPSRPPSIPLPPPPNSNPPTPPTSTAPSVFSTRTPYYSSSSLRRPRAHTVSVIPPAPRTSPPSPPTSPGIPKRAKSIDKGAGAEKSSDKENTNLDTATMEELKQALTSRTQQYEDLASHLLKITATHVAEKNALEKKISTLERDAARKDKEIKGLTWLLVNNRISLGGADVEAALNSAQLAYRPAAGPPKVSHRFVRGADESESIQTSGAESISESILSSGTSGTESHSSLPMKKARRPTLAETTYNLYRSSSKLSRGLGVETDSSIRSSVYSLSSSATSSTSSLLPPSPSGAGSPLSAIPEGPNQAPSPSRVMRERGSLSAGEGEKDDRRTTSSRSSNRISASSFASSSSSASPATSAYSANLKRGRPPSISQVLEKSSAVEDVLQKLRPFKLTAAAP